MFFFGDFIFFWDLGFGVWGFLDFRFWGLGIFSVFRILDFFSDCCLWWDDIIYIWAHPPGPHPPLLNGNASQYQQAGHVTPSKNAQKMHSKCIKHWKNNAREVFLQLRTRRQLIKRGGACAVICRLMQLYAANCISLHAVMRGYPSL